MSSPSQGGGNVWGMLTGAPLRPQPYRPLARDGRANFHKAKGQDRCWLNHKTHIKCPPEQPGGHSHLRSATLLFSIDATTTSRTDSAVFVRTLRKKPSDVQHLPPW